MNGCLSKNMVEDLRQLQWMVETQGYQQCSPDTIARALGNSQLRSHPHAVKSKMPGPQTYPRHVLVPVAWLFTAHRSDSTSIPTWMIHIFQGRYIPDRYDLQYSSCFRVAAV